MDFHCFGTWQCINYPLNELDLTCYLEEICSLLCSLRGCSICSSRLSINSNFKIRTQLFPHHSETIPLHDNRNLSYSSKKFSLRLPAPPPPKMSVRHFKQSERTVNRPPLRNLLITCKYLLNTFQVSQSGFSE